MCPILKNLAVKSLIYLYSSPDFIEDKYPAFKEPVVISKMVK